MKTTAQDGKVVAILSVKEDTDLMIITKDGKIIRIESGEIRQAGRSRRACAGAHGRRRSGGRRRRDSRKPNRAERTARTDRAICRCSRRPFIFRGAPRVTSRAGRRACSIARKCLISFILISYADCFRSLDFSVVIREDLTE